MTNASPPHAEFAAYDIRLRGQLDPRWASRLGVSSLTHEPNGTTRLRTHPADQPALHGLLQRVRDLGLPLISATRIEPDVND
jgi:hypothetical protein